MINRHRSPRSRDELLKVLAEQRAALAASCSHFDEGAEWEAPRLATAVANLVYDRGSTTSILTQLGLRGRLRFLSTGRIPDNSAFATSPPLVAMRIEKGGGRFVAHLSNGVDRRETLQFYRWWEKELIFKSHESAKSLNRMRLVLTLRNQDGGSHFGEVTDLPYRQLKAGAGFFGGPLMHPFSQGSLATMRQVAYEITETLKVLDGNNPE